MSQNHHLMGHNSLALRYAIAHTRFMSNPTLIEALTKFANSDLALARLNRKVGVAQTKMGPLEIEYTASVYTISAQGKVLAIGSAKVARKFLMGAYDVVVAS